MGPSSPSSASIEAGIYWRYSNYDTPFWVRNNTNGGRWNRPGELPTQYLASGAAGAWAELIRREHLTEERQVAAVRMPLWSICVNQAGLADYGTFDKAEASGFPPEALINDDYERCQVEGERLRELGYKGVIAPSAALPGAVNVTVWGARSLSPWGQNPRLASRAAATVVAVGSPPPGLVLQVRHYGGRHAQYEHYARRAPRKPEVAKRARRANRPRGGPA